MSETADGLWAAFVCAVVVPRQNGKGSILEARELAGLFLLNESLILHSAHEFKTCYEHFLRIVSLIESTPDFDRRVQKIRRGVGEQAIELRNGNRLRFIARSGGSGRGMSAPCVVLDEAMFLTEAQVGAIMPTLSAQANPQIWYTSSAPLSSSAPLHRLRRQAIAQEGQRVFYAEWGNEVGADPTDDEAIARANPALGRRIFLDFVDAEREAMSGDEFARERLGVPESEITLEDGPIDMAYWYELADDESQIAAGHSWALAVSPVEHGPQWASLGVAGRTADGRFQVEWMEHRKGTAWIVQRVLEAQANKPIPLRVHASGPEGALIPSLREAGADVVEVPSAEVERATGLLIAAATGDDNTAPSLVHLGQPSLDKAVRGAVLRTGTNGAAMWSQKHSKVEITPLQAVTVALGGVPLPSRTPRVHVYSGEG